MNQNLTYNILIGGLCKTGAIEKAIDVLREMLVMGYVPTPNYSQVSS